MEGKLQRILGNIVGADPAPAAAAAATPTPAGPKIVWGKVVEPVSATKPVPVLAAPPPTREPSGPSVIPSASGQPTPGGFAMRYDQPTPTPKPVVDKKALLDFDPFASSDEEDNGADDDGVRGGVEEMEFDPWGQDDEEQEEEERTGAGSADSTPVPKPAAAAAAEAADDWEDGDAEAEVKKYLGGLSAEDKEKEDKAAEEKAAEEKAAEQKHNQEEKEKEEKEKERRQKEEEKKAAEAEAEAEAEESEESEEEPLTPLTPLMVEPVTPVVQIVEHELSKEEILGNRLYFFVYDMNPEEAGRITGMLMEQPFQNVVQVLRDQEEQGGGELLRKQVEAATAAIKEIGREYSEEELERRRQEEKEELRRLLKMRDQRQQAEADELAALLVRAHAQAEEEEAAVWRQAEAAVHRMRQQAEAEAAVEAAMRAAVQAQKSDRSRWVQRQQMIKQRQKEKAARTEAAAARVEAAERKAQKATQEATRRTLQSSMKPQRAVRQAQQTPLTAAAEQTQQSMVLTPSPFQPRPSSPTGGSEPAVKTPSRAEQKRLAAEKAAALEQAAKEKAAKKAAAAASHVPLSAKPTGGTAPESAEKQSAPQPRMPLLVRRPNAFDSLTLRFQAGRGAAAAEGGGSPVWMLEQSLLPPPHTERGFRLVYLGSEPEFVAGGLRCGTRAHFRVSVRMPGLALPSVPSATASFVTPLAPPAAPEAPVCTAIRYEEPGSKKAKKKQGADPAGSGVSVRVEWRVPAWAERGPATRFRLQSLTAQGDGGGTWLDAATVRVPRSFWQQQVRDREQMLQDEGPDGEDGEEGGAAAAGEEEEEEEEEEDGEDDESFVGQEKAEDEDEDEEEEEEDEEEDGSSAKLGQLMVHTVTGLEPDVMYYFRVQAINSAGVGPSSVPNRVVSSQLPPRAPSVPTLVGSVPLANSIRIQWTAPPGTRDADSELALVYLLQREGRPDVLLAPYRGGATTEYKQGRLAPESTYRFRVCAMNAAGRGAFSEWAGFKTAAAPRDAPRPPRFSKVSAMAVRGRRGSEGGRGVQRQWEYPWRALLFEWHAADGRGSAVTQYTLQLKLLPKPGATEEAKGGEYQQVHRGNGNRRQCTVEKLLPGRKYMARVQAHTGAGVSPYSATATVCTELIEETPAEQEAKRVAEVKAAEMKELARIARQPKQVLKKRKEQTKIVKQAVKAVKEEKKEEVRKDRVIQKSYLIAIAVFLMLGVYLYYLNANRQKKRRRWHGVQ
jgi:hypothetical protein